MHVTRQYLVSTVLCAALATLGCSSAEPPTAPDAVPLAPDGAAPTGEGVVGRWRRTGYTVSGSAALAVENGTARLTFSSDFSIAQTPGPVVYLNTTSNPNSGRPLRIGALKSRNGAQSYTFQVPTGVRYSYIIIWCDPFNVSMAEAPIPLTP